VRRFARFGNHNQLGKFPLYREVVVVVVLVVVVIIIIKWKALNNSFTNKTATLGT
jgi:hypothetical protein